MKKKKNVQDFVEFNEIVENQDKALEMNYDDFLDVKMEVLSAKYATSKTKLEIASAVKFKKGSTKIYWKSSHKNENYSSSEFLQKKAMAKLRVPFAKNAGPRGINTEKKKR